MAVTQSTASPHKRVHRFQTFHSDTHDRTRSCSNSRDEQYCLSVNLYYAHPFPWLPSPDECPISKHQRTPFILYDSYMSRVAFKHEFWVFGMF